MQTIEQLLTKVFKLQAMAKDMKVPAQVLHLSPEDEATLLVELWKANPADKAPNVRKAYTKLAGYPLKWDAQKTSLGQAASLPETAKPPEAANKTPTDPKEAAGTAPKKKLGRPPKKRA